MAKADKYVVRTSDKTASDSFPFQHPLNSNSRLNLLPLSDFTGMQRLGVSIGRIPPGKEGFLPHAHTTQEEFIYILEGTGTLSLDDEVTTLNPGDFVGFPTDGMVHHLANDGTADLVYLMGGERTATEVSDFPTLNMKGFWANGEMRYVKNEHAAPLKPEDFAAKPDP